MISGGPYTGGFGVSRLLVVTSRLESDVPLLDGTVYCGFTYFAMHLGGS